jgi:hypothetical protein
MIYNSGDLHGDQSAYIVTSAKFQSAKRGDVVICAAEIAGA